MLELLLSSGSNGAGFIPGSGPGSQTLLYGNADAGFFGEVSSAEMFTTQELADQVGAPAGAVINDPAPAWLKFAYKGKILFTPKKVTYNTVMWAALYYVGLMYGEDTNGPLESLIPYKGVNQLKLASKSGHRFLVRTPRNAVSNPATLPANNTEETPYTIDTEWHQLMLSVSASFAAKSQNRWAAYSNADLSFNIYQLMQEHDNDGLYGTIILRIGQGAVSNAVLRVGPNSVSASRFWRPVLELVPPDTMFRATDFTYTSDAVLLPLGAMAIKSALTMPLVDVGGYSVVIEDLNYVLRPGDVTYTSDALRPLGIPLSRPSEALSPLGGYSALIEVT